MEERTLEIRNINEEDDRYAISHVYEESWKFAYQSIIPQTYLDNIPKGNWVNVIKDAERSTLLLLEENKIVGVTSYCQSRFPDLNEYGEIISIYLLPQYIGKGYGKMLFDAAIKQLRQRGFHDIFLWVLEENEKALT